MTKSGQGHVEVRTLYLIIHYQTDNDLMYNYNKSKNNYLRKLIQLLDAYSNKNILFLHRFYVLLSIDFMIMYVHCTVGCGIFFYFRAQAS